MNCLTIFTHEGAFSGDILVPMHTLVSNPLAEGVLFASRNIENTSARKIPTGRQSTEEISGTFINGRGDFLVLSRHTFLIFTPKTDEDTMALSVMLLPTHATHGVVFAAKNSVHRIKPGSSIMCINPNGTILSTSFFTPLRHGPLVSNLLIDRSANAMMIVYYHMSEIIRALHDKTNQTIVIERFETFEPSKPSPVFAALTTMPADAAAPKRQKH